MRTPALAGLAILAAAAPALAADRPVGKGRRYPTIQSAVDAAEPGDRIVVGKGVYRESVWFGGKDGLTFVGRGAVWDGRISRGNTASCLEFDASGVTVEGFTFRNGVFHVRGFGTANVVRRCVARNADTYSVGLEGSDAVVESCRISGSGDAAIQVRGERGTVKSSRCSNVAATAIRVEGGAARIAGNTVLTVREGAGVSVNGSHAEVTDNRLSGFGWGAIVIYGDDVAVRRNVCASTSEWEAALQVEGQRVLVEDNRVTAAGGFGVMVSGDAMTVRRNRVSDSTRPAAGFRLQSATESGGGRVEDNVAVRTGHVGFDVALRNASVRRCVAVDCGRSAGAAFRVEGSRTDFADCRVEGAFETGFTIWGESLEFARCRVRDATGDGFQVRAPDVRLLDCEALRCGGEGLDNGSTGTLLDGCTLKRNRIDLACDASNGATFADPERLATDNSWVTGGPDTQPERDD